MLFLDEREHAGSCTFVVKNCWCKIWKELIILLESASEGTEFRIIVSLIETASPETRQFQVYY